MGDESSDVAADRTEHCHRGWWMLVGCMLITAASGTGHSFSIAPFVDEWMQRLEISRYAFSSIWTIAMIASCVVAPFMGTWIDRFGSRRVLFLCLPGSVGSLVWLALASSPFELTIALTLNRVLNADTLPLVGVTTLNRWFVKHRGRASTAIGLVWAWLLEFPGIEIAIQRWVGFASADLILSAYVGLLIIICCTIWRDTPESIGLLPDLTSSVPPKETACQASEQTSPNVNVVPEMVEPISEQSETEVNFSRAQAIRTFMFWSVVLMQFAQNSLWQGCHLHLLDVLHLHGLGDVAAGLFYTAVAVSRTILSLVLGCVILDRLGRKVYLILVVSIIPQVLVTLLLLGFLGPPKWKPWMAFLLGVVYGIWGGIVSAADGVLYAQLFGREHLGSITGLAKGIMRISGVIGPLFFGISRDWFGSYNVPLISLMALSICSGTMLLLTPLPQVVTLTAVSAKPVAIGRHVSYERVDVEPTVSEIDHFRQ